jgi:hypothetical protein
VIVDKGQLFGDLNDGQLVARRIDPRVLHRSRSPAGSERTFDRVKIDFDRLA